MITSPSHQSGFSAIELLIALFIAVIFLTAGHQLYNAIVQDSGEIRQRARANNVAYNILRKYSDGAPGACGNETVVDDQPVTPTPEGLVNVRHTVTYSCPQTNLPSVTRVQVAVSYGEDSKEVIHAIYANQ